VVARQPTAKETHARHANDISLEIETKYGATAHWRNYPRCWWLGTRRRAVCSRTGAFLASISLLRPERSQQAHGNII